MNRTVSLALCICLLLVGGVYLFQVDYDQKLDTDVSSLLPNVESTEAKIARELISEEQGRAVYLEVTGIAGREDLEMALLKELRASAWVESAIRFDGRMNLPALALVNDHRIELLFPKWLSKHYKLYLDTGDSAVDFVDWATEQAVTEMDSFLESPESIELARKELLDPLLLSVGALLRLSAGGGDGAFTQAPGEQWGGQLYWLKLASSPLSRATQEGFAADVGKIELSLSGHAPGFEIAYGGLAKLAGASRERIQRDVFKINVLSFAGVALAGGLLASRPWRLFGALPSLLGGLIGGLAVSFLVFDSVNVIVLIVGSILIGTAIDYAIHLIFSDPAAVQFPTSKLVGYACFSTVAGFSVLVFADLALIRQIGVFVGAGLLSAYITAKLSIVTVKAPLVVGPEATHGRGARHKGVWVVLATVMVIVGGIGWLDLRWVDDLRNLEAPDDELVSEDLALRAKFGSSSGSSYFISTGETYFDVFESEALLLDRLTASSGQAESFGFSLFSPSRSEMNLLRELQPQLPRLFVELKAGFEAAGYESESFVEFFDEAQKYTDEGTLVWSETETLLQRLAETFRGPMEGVLGEFEGQRWSLASARIPTVAALSVVENLDGSTLFSQLGFLNEALGLHREALLRFGMLAAALVSGVILFAFGLKRGLLIVAYPIFGGGVAIGLCSLFLGDLNMFHLVGCFLGGAIALDYALFAIEAYSRDLRLPQSVWLSAGTTTASFIALGFSAVPVVRGLGWLVALLACTTLLLLHCSQPFLRRILKDDGTD